MGKDDKDNSIGFRISSEDKKSVELYASKRGFSVGDFVLFCVFKGMGETEKVNEILEKNVIGK